MVEEESEGKIMREMKVRGESNEGMESEKGD